MAAGRDNNISVTLCENSFIFIFDYGCADCGFFNIIKTEFLERIAHCSNTCAVIVCNERRCKADNNGVSALNKHFYLFNFIDNFLCILRTNNKTLTAKDTLIAYDMRLVSRKTDSLNGAMTDAFITVFAV